MFQNQYMDYKSYRIQCPPELRDIIIAFLGEAPFDTFEETASGLVAYIPAEAATEEVEVQVKALQKQFEFAYEVAVLPAENWNAVWESNFQPIIVGAFCGIRALFHPLITTVKHELIIQPKMAFGTGHHSTTFQMLQLMESIDFRDRTVLDYGCGTGVLAMIAALEFAAKVDAIDYDEWSYYNTIENTVANHIQGIEVLHGTLELVEERQYDIILANITLNVISVSLPALHKMLNMDGVLLCSGFFVEDSAYLIQQAQALGFQIIQQSERNDWACVQFVKA